jgi:hypothetical protein
VHASSRSASTTRSADGNQAPIVCKESSSRQGDWRILAFKDKAEAFQEEPLRSCQEGGAHAQAERGEALGGCEEGCSHAQAEREKATPMSASVRQREALRFYYAAHVRGWSIQSVPPFNMRTINSLKRHRWLAGPGKLCNITSAGIKALGCSTTAKIVAQKSKTARMFQQNRMRG